jgi:hypothetical protein
VTYIVTPAPMTTAIATAWPFIAHKSRNSFRSRMDTQDGMLTIAAP